MKRTGLIAAVLAATTMIVPSAAAQEAARLVVSGTGGGGLQLRAGPGFDQPRLGTLPEGTIVTSLDDGSAEWVAVQPPRNLGLPSGYASAAYLAPLLVEASAPSARIVQAIVTGYANGSDGGAVGTTTASGTKTHWGTVAADWRLLPLGTSLQIEGFDGVTFTVEDSGSGVHGLIIDVWFPDVPSARAFGTQRRKVTILP